MRTGTILTGLMLAASCLPAVAAALGDAETLYCAQVYADTARELAAAPNEEAAVAAADAQQRVVPLGERDHELLNEHPRRHARASVEAQRRLALLPAAPAAARSAALLAAYESCRDLEEGAAVTGERVSERAQLLGDRRFCRDLLARTGKVSAALRAHFNADEAAALEGLLKISRALAQPLPGRPVRPAEDKQASEIAAQRRAALDAAVAGWRDREDPLVREMNRCYDDYAQGRLGGPNVLAQETAGAASATAAISTPLPLPEQKASDEETAGASAPTVDLGEVFHMREIMPGGNYEGIWRRRGISNIYDALWVHAASGQVSRDVLEVRGVQNGEIVIHRQGMNGVYRARVREDGTLASGTASWITNPTYRWQPLPAQNVRIGLGRLGRMQRLPPLLHMREVLFSGNYEGIWRRRSESNVYDALWVHMPTGEISADTLVVSGVQRGQLVIRRQHARGSYFAPVLADGRLLPGTASWVSDPAYYWTILPAQSVNLGSAASP